MEKIMLKTVYANREGAGRVLSRLLGAYGKNRSILAIAVGKCSVPVAAPVCKALGIDLDVIAAESVVIPNSFGEIRVAVTSEGDSYINTDTSLFPSSYQRLIDRVCHFEKVRLRQELSQYRLSRELAQRKDRHIILIDDGACTESLIAAAQTIEKCAPRSITIARPYATCKEIDECRLLAEHVICAQILEKPISPQRMYKDNHIPSRAEVRYLLWDTWYGAGFYASVVEQGGCQLNDSQRRGAEPIRKDHWQAFLHFFSMSYKGWSVSLKQVCYSENCDTAKGTFHVRTLVSISRFNGLKCKPNSELELSFFLNESVQRFLITKTCALYFHDADQDHKILRVSAGQESFYIQVSLERFFNLNL